MTVYNPNTPLASERISDTQQPIRDNFFLANQFFGIDHFEFDALSNNGKHKQVTLTDRTATPPAPGVSECAIYGRTTAGETYAFLRRDGGTLDYPVTPVRSWAVWNLQVAPGVLPPASIVASFNITQIEKLATVGQYRLTFPALPTANYLVLISGEGNSNSFVEVIGASRMTNSVEIRNLTNQGVPVDGFATYHLLLIQ